MVEGLVARNVAIAYSGARSDVPTVAVADLSATVESGKVLAIVGPSGCGKSSFLAVLAGLVPYQSGIVTFGGEVIDGPGADRGMVFQSPSLLPWRSVLDNVAFGARLRGASKAEARRTAGEMLALVGLDGQGDRFPYELSGGMQQRVNVARALGTRPKLLLLDEPFGALDGFTRATLQCELLRIVEELGDSLTVVFVTHQLDEAVFLADDVLVVTPGPASRVGGLMRVDLGRPRAEELRRTEKYHSTVDQLAVLVARTQLSAAG